MQECACSKTKNGVWLKLRQKLLQNVLPLLFFVSFFALAETLAQRQKHRLHFLNVKTFLSRERLRDYYYVFLFSIFFTTQCLTLMFTVPTFGSTWLDSGLNNRRYKTKKTFLYIAISLNSIYAAIRAQSQHAHIKYRLWSWLRMVINLIQTDLCKKEKMYRKVYNMCFKHKLKLDWYQKS